MSSGTGSVEPYSYRGWQQDSPDTGESFCLIRGEWRNARRIETDPFVRPHIHHNATTHVNGYMSWEDKVKLDSIESGASDEMTAAEILAALLTVDGAGSLLDADKLDGNEASAFALNGHSHSDATTSVAGFMSATDKTKLDGIEAGAGGDMSASEILAALLTVDGSGCLLDADKLDGNEASAFSLSGHTHSYLPLGGGTVTGELISTSTSGISLESSNPAIWLSETDQGTDLKNWLVSVYNQSIYIQSRTDAKVNISNLLSLNRNGSLTVLGNVSCGSSTLCTNLNADLLDGYHISAGGNRWGVVPFVDGSGVFEVGKYFDFHGTDDDTGDYDVRLTGNSGYVACSGYLTCGVTTLCTNLNADLLDGYHSSSFSLDGHTHSYLPLGGGTLTGSLQVIPPSTLYSSASNYNIGGASAPMGILYSHGSYRTSLLSNGYRNSSGTWTSFGVNSYTGASGIELDPQGYIYMYADASKASDDAYTIDRVVSISPRCVMIGSIGPTSNVSLCVAANRTGATSVYQVISAGETQSDVTAGSYSFHSQPGIASDAAVGTICHYHATQGTYSGTLNYQYGFLAASTLISGATNNIGFYGAIPSTATGAYNLYMSGTASNYMLGNTGIGGLPDSTHKLKLTGSQIIYNSSTPSASVTDGAILYAADIAAGHRALHVRNENDTVIKLYQQALIASPSADVASLKTAVDAIRTLLINSGQMAAS